MHREERPLFFLPGKAAWLVSTWIIIFAFNLFLSSVRADVTPDYVLDLDIEDLMRTEVTSVSRYDQLLLDAPAAVTVIDQEKIQRSGRREMQEILRLVPGLQIARYSAGLWSVSSRSFPDYGVKKLLVLYDGRSLYSEDVGQVYWETQSFILQDLEQIEVIRGPGGTYWGYNAVNGVINIMSKKARDTQGILVDSAVRDDGSTYAQARYGGKINDNLYYRLFHDAKDQSGFQTVSGEDADDGFRLHNTGLRFDLESSPDTLWTFEAAAGHGKDRYAWYSVDNVFTFDDRHMRLRLDHTFTDDLDFMGQAYFSQVGYTYAETQAFGKGFTIDQTLADIDLQLNWRLGSRHRIVAGGGGRYSGVHAESGYQLFFEESKTDWSRYNLLLTDEVTVIPQTLFFTLGTKLEHNDLTGWGWQPSTRLLYKPTPTQSLWASISRALRMPCFEDIAKRYQITPYPDFIIYRTGEPVKDEEIISYELGYRNFLSPALSLDLAAYYNELSQLRFFYFTINQPREPGAPFIINSYNNYETDARTRGAEVTLTWQATKQFTLSAGYAYFHTDYSVPRPKTWISPPPEKAERHMAQVTANMNFTEGVQLDTILCWNNEARFASTEIPAYWRLDVRLSLPISDNAAISFTGQHLLDDEHIEIINGELTPGQESTIPRSVLMTLTMRF